MATPSGGRPADGHFYCGLVLALSKNLLPTARGIVMHLTGDCMHRVENAGLSPQIVFNNAREQETENDEDGKGFTHRL